MEEVAEEEHDSSTLSEHLERQYGLWDLVAVGVGGTLGTGVFTLVGQIASNEAGPGILISLGIGATGCLLTACSYVELSSAVPCSGSVYSYAYVGIGEVVAVIAAAGLTLEYGVSGAAVAVTWGSKVATVAGVGWLKGDGVVPIAAAGVFLMLLCVGLMVVGVREGRLFTNVVTVAKCLVVAFMISCAFCWFQPQNLNPFIPRQYGLGGVMRGALDSFFGFLGFDEVCCLAGVAQNPRTTMPVAVILSVTTVAAFMMVAALALVAMVPYSQMDPNDGFYSGFKSVGWDWAAYITVAGEISTLPVVVFISVMPQCHLFKEIADDGLLPALFAKVQRGVLLQSTLVCGFLLTVLTAFVDFDALNDMISAGCLLSFIIASCSVLMVRDVVTGGRSRLGGPLATFTLTCFVGAGLMRALLERQSDISNFKMDLVEILLTVSIALCVIVALIAVVFLFRRTPSRRQMPDQTLFLTPGGPALPCCSIVFNTAMLFTLSLKGCLMIVGYFGVALLIYFLYGRRNAMARRKLRPSVIDNAPTTPIAAAAA